MHSRTPAARRGGRLSRRHAAALGLALLLLAGTSPRPADAQANEVARPNIVVMVADDLGWADVGYHTDSIATPNIDRLAAQGIRLERFYAAPICSPTRTGLMTGRYPDRFGLRDGVINPDDMRGLPPTAVTIAEALAPAGYARRIALGKWHLGHSSILYHPLSQGFTEFYGDYTGAIDYFTHNRNGELDWHRNFETSHDEGYSTDLLAAKAERFIQESKSGEPFLLYLAFNAVHGPLQGKPEDLERHGFDPTQPTYRGESPAEQKRSAAEGKQGRRGNGNTLRQTYLAALTGMDDAIGRVLAALDTQGLAENTLVLFMSDNGGPEGVGADNGPLRGAKSTVWEGGVRVPAVVRWPARLAGGRQEDDLVAYIDLMPTLRHVAGLPAAPAGTLDGLDVSGVLAGTEAGSDRLLYLGDGGIVSPRWKYVRGELFDLIRDPYETTNVAAGNPAVMKRMEQALAEFQTIERPPTETGKYRAPPEWKMPERAIGAPL